MKKKKIVSLLLVAALASSLSLTGCDKINKDAVAATIGDKEISLGYLNFVAHYTQSTYDSYLSSYYGDGFWTNEDYVDDNGETMEETVKDDIISQVEMQYLMEQHMADYDVEVTEDDQAKITEAAEKFMSDNDNKAINAMGATQEYVETMLYYLTIQSRMTEAIEADIDTEVTDEEAARGTFAYVELDKYTTDDSGVVDVLSTDEELASLETDAESIMDSAQQLEAEGSEASDDATDPLSEAAETYGYSSTSGTFNPNEDPADNEDYDVDMLTAVEKLDVGEYDIVETDSAYYVIRLDSELDETATENARSTILSERANDRYTEVTDGYLNDSDFELDEAQWAKVKFDKQFTIVTDDDDDLSVTE